MNKHISFILCLLVACFTLQAGDGVGSWKIYSAFDGVEKMVETPRVIYYISVGQLYSLDKETGETYNYSTSNRLSGSEATGLHYDYNKKYLVVSYSDAALDLIDRNDRVYGMPDIRDAELDVIPVVNDVAFDDNSIYVATNFGLVVFNGDRKEVITSGRYGRNITKVFIQGPTLWLVEGYKFHAIDKTRNITKFSDFNQEVFAQTVNEVHTLNDEKVLMIVNGNAQFKIFSLAPEKNKSKQLFLYDGKGLKNLHPMADGGFSLHDKSSIITVNTAGEVNIHFLNGSDMVTSTQNGLDEVKNLTAYDGIDEIYMGSAEGISEYSIDEGEITKLMGGVKPEGLTFSRVGRLHVGKSGKIYATEYGQSQQMVSYYNDDHTLYHVNVIDGDDITDVTPREYTVDDSNNRSLTYLPYGFKSGNQLVEDPNDPDAYYVTSMWDGIYHFKDGKQLHKYYSNNSTLRTVGSNGGLRVFTMDFDRRGNLWTAQFILGNNDNSQRQFHMLTAAGVKEGETTEADWKYLTTLRESHRDGQILALKSKDILLYKDASYGSGITAIFTKGTDNVDDDEVFTSTSLIDQDGQSFTYNYINHMAEDHNGRVWIGTDNGVIELTNPESINSSIFNIMRIKVPRNDGTNFADYLLSGESVYNVAVDHSDRKWLATAASGVYLVSPTGDKILEHFDITNSPLPVNEVNAVACGNDNGVYFGTTRGLYEYRSESAPAAEDFNEVYAYPNPVRPEYTGLISIVGLMENSLVKIADSAGNVFHQARSEGGMVTWDGCDRSGNRVPTGVYYVFASHGGDGESSHGAVTKIMIVN